jgi:hypothetical protein
MYLCVLYFIFENKQSFEFLSTHQGIFTEGGRLKTVLAYTVIYTDDTVDIAHRYTIYKYIIYMVHSTVIISVNTHYFEKSDFLNFYFLHNLMSLQNKMFENKLYFFLCSHSSILKISTYNLLLIIYYTSFAIRFLYIGI